MDPDIITDINTYYDYLERVSLHLKIPVIFTPDEGIPSDLGELDIDLP